MKFGSKSVGDGHSRPPRPYDRKGGHQPAQKKKKKDVEKKRWGLGKKKYLNERRSLKNEERV